MTRMPPLHRRPPAARRRGLTLVELMVGVVVGLFVVAAAALLVSGQLAENRRLLLDTQLQQDLRATADIITRELRRTGATRDAWKGIWSPAAPAVPNVLNRNSAEVTNPTSRIEFDYDRGGSWVGTWFFDLVGGAIRTKVVPGSTGPEQDLTDPNTMVVDRFEVTLEPLARMRIPCPTLCAGNNVNCWPEQVVYEFLVEIEAHAKADGNVKRSIRSRVRQRADKIAFNAAGATPQACPS